jgi:hypothetical protein
MSPTRSTPARHPFESLAAAHQRQHLPGARTLRVRHPGCLSIRGGAAWLTVDGEAQDRRLADGDQLYLLPGHRVVLEPWSPGERVRWQWQPEPVPRSPWRGLSAAARAALGQPACRTAVPAG